MKAARMNNGNATMKNILIAWMTTLKKTEPERGGEGRENKQIG
jgi:hypothetical protein